MVGKEIPIPVKNNVTKQTLCWLAKISKSRNDERYRADPVDVYPSSTFDGEDKNDQITRLSLRAAK